MTLVVVGSVAFDSIKTPEDEVHDALGGSAVHFSLSARLFAKTRLVGVVGDDFPAAHRTLLAERGVDLAGLETVSGGKTFRWSGEYFDAMNRRETRSVELNVFENFTPRLPDEYRTSEYAFLANGAPSTQASVLEQLRKPAFVLADTMDLWLHTARDDLDALLRRIDGLVLNDSEAELLTGEPNLVRAGRAIQETYGLAALVVKKGEHGCIIFHGGREVQLPAYPLAEVVDPTGAGDSFAGGLMGYLAAQGATGLDALKHAAAWGTVCASFCCQGFGVDGLVSLDRARLDERYAAYREMIAL